MYRIFAALCAATIVLTMNALSPRTLPAPDKTGGKPLMQTLAERHSVREFAPTPFTDRMLGDLLWAANGINRPDGHRTAPSAMNRQEIDLYVLDAQGAWLYEPETHSLRPVAEGDHRALLNAGQDFAATAPVSIVMVMNGDKFQMTGDRADLMMGADAGIVCENINLFCSSAGLKTVPRASMDTDALVTLLNLPSTQRPILNNPVGY